MLSLFGKGAKESVVVTDTARKWGLKKRTVYQDWYRRGRWIREVAGFKDVKKAFGRC